jgi:radical SAM superfamily enzyme YgiQ (UPF0313 family)
LPHAARAAARDRRAELLSREIRLQPHRAHADLRIALAYPNLYYVGMSNLGFQGVQAQFDSFEDMSCERAFLPEEDERDAMDVLRSFESATPLRDFDVVAFSVAFENDYLHVVQMLRFAGIPLRARDRTKRDPVVLIGGSATFLNPEPLAPFADVFAIGEGEILVPALVAAWRQAGSPRAALESDALRPEIGFYVPSRYRIEYAADGQIARVDYDGGASGTVNRQRAYPKPGDPGMLLPQTTILTPDTEMSMKFMIEISRGCPCMCRFCWAGYNYLPVRGFSRKQIVERAREVRAHTNRIGLVSTAVCDHPEIEGIVDDLAALGFEVSVASLRLDDLSPEFVFKLVDTGVQGLTLAPECGSERMRRILNKQFTNADILARARWIFENGVQNLKLYYMTGLPFETRADVEAIVTLTEQIRDIMVEVGKSRGRVGRIHPSVNPFVPKPGTPFQWLAMENVKETDEKLQFLRRAFAKIPNVDAICKSARTGFHQTILALGDRRVADALEFAAVNGSDLKRAAREVGIDPAFYVYREKGKDEILPWDVIDNGVSRAYFWKELEKSRREALSPHCPEIQGCIRCGVCEDQPNPSYALPEKWKALGTSPRYLPVRPSV